MRALVCISVALVLSAGAGARTASAQGTAARPASQASEQAPRVRISINLGSQLSSIAFAGRTTQPVYLENAVVDTSYGVGSGLTIDGGVLFRVGAGFHIGVAVSSFSKRRDGSVAATIPHPFFFNKPRPIDGTAPNLERNELVTHLQAAYVLSPGKLDIALSAGPSWFSVKQGLVTGVTFTEIYPYDTTTFAAASTTSVRASSKVGFNVGLDIGVRLSKKVGVGALARFSQTTVEFPVAGAATNPTSRAGGVEAAAGLRLYF